MKVSLGLYPNQTSAEVIKAAHLAEEAGFDKLWMVDSHLLFREVYTLFGAIAATTKRIKLGTAVTNPLTRHPTVTASAFSTLKDLSGDRAILGISVGDSALRTMNLAPAKMKELETSIEQCRGLFEGDKVAFGDASTAGLTLPEGQVPIYIAATGPKMLRMTGRIGDGVILMNGIAPDLIEAAIDLLREGEKEAGRPEGSTNVAVWAACHTDCRAVKYNVARAILRKIPGPIDDLTRQVAVEVKKVYNYEQHARAEAEFAKLIPDELVRRFAFSGSPSQIQEQIHALKPLGVDEVILSIPHAEEFRPREDVIADIVPWVITKGGAA